MSSRSRPSLSILATCAALACGACGGGAPAGGDHAPAGHHDDHHDDGRGGDHDEGHGEGVVELSAEAVERAAIETAPAALRPIAGTLVTTGEVGYDERRIARVSPRIGGRVVQIQAELGDRVTGGAPLAVVDSVELGRAKAAYLRARAHHEVARLVHERQRKLFTEGIASEEETLEAEADARAEAAELAAAEEMLHLYGLDHDAIGRLDYDDPEASLFTVRAPFDGKVVEKEAGLGEIVAPDTHLFTVADLSVVWIWIDLYERDLRHVAVGDEARVEVDAFPEADLVGRVSYVGDQVRPESRTVRARVDLPNPERRLKPGMFARVALATGEEAPTPVLAVPRTAVQRDGAESIVFVRTGPGRFERREVEIGRVTADFVEILGGLAEGDQVVTEGAFLLRSQASADELGGHHH